VSVQSLQGPIDRFYCGTRTDAAAGKPQQIIHGGDGLAAPFLADTSVLLHKSL
jgi:hypothetical protein